MIYFLLQSPCVNTNLSANYLGYPIWKSFGLLEVRKYDKALLHWLSYWVLYALLWNLENLVYFLIDGGSFPVWYKTLKLLVILWLINPNYLGALYIYTIFMDEVYELHKEKALEGLYFIVEKVNRALDWLLNKLG